MIAFTCQKCGKQYHLQPEFAGRKTTCSVCKEPIVIPAPETPQTVAPEAKARVSFSCTKCGMKFNVLPEFAGRKTTCPACKEALVVPSPDQTVAYVPSAGQIDGPASSLAQAEVDAGITLGGGVAGRSSLQDLMGGKSRHGARYIIEKELARGGMGAVLRGVDCDIRREVAVKYLLDQSSAKNKIRFVEEAQITGQLEHPNIVPIHELGVDAQKRIFFTMKMVKGRSLAQILKLLRDGEPSPVRGRVGGAAQPDPSRGSARQEYTLSRLLNIFVNVCNALAYAHSRGVVHRDLKPANIMVGDFGEVYVMDWGLAKVLDKTTSLDTGPPMAIPVAALAVSAGDGVIPLASPAAPMASPIETPSGPGVSFSAGSGKVVTSREEDADLTQAGVVMGTPVYMPPEQAAGQVHDIDERSDVYSMGAILYEMLTLRTPIDKAGGFWPIVQRVTHGQIEPPDKKAPERARAGKIPVELAAVALKALAKRKDDRYQTIEALRKDIERFMEGRSVSAKPDTIREMAVKLVKRNKGVSIATAAAAVILCAVGVWSLISILGANARTQKAYDSYVAEQMEKREQAKRSVPSFVRAAKLLIAEKQFDDALAQVETALNNDETAVDARYLRAQLSLGRQDYAKARTDLEICWRQKPERDDIKKLLDIAQTGTAENTDTLLALSEELARQKGYTLAALVTGHAEKLLGARQKLLEHYRARIESAWPRHGERLTVINPMGELQLNFEKVYSVTDLSPLRGMPLASVSFSNCIELGDLTPLEGMPIVNLSLYSCIKISDLKPLKGMPLSKLDLSHCFRITDLTPLKGMPLTELGLHGCPITDISVLKGMPLSRLNLETCPVKDLTPLSALPLKQLILNQNSTITDIGPLRGLRLTDLSLSSCPGIDNLEPLKDMPLTTLGLSDCARIDNLQPLKGMPLITLNLHGCAKIDNLQPLKGMPLKSLNMIGCAKVSDLEPLKRMPLTELDLQGCINIRSLIPLENMPLKGLNLNACENITDFTPLNGLMLSTLVLSNTKFNDLYLIKDMPLTFLHAGSCVEIRDFSPLRSMKLTNVDLSCKNFSDLSLLKHMELTALTIAGSSVADLTPVKGMPIGQLRMQDCRNLHDLTPLAGMPLETVTLPPQVTKGMELLRAMQTLHLIDSQPAEQFWKKWDTAKAKSK